MTNPFKDEHIESEDPTQYRLYETLRPDEPCDHPGCLSHVTHPCEGCGRTAGRFPRSLSLKDAILRATTEMVNELAEDTARLIVDAVGEDESLSFDDFVEQEYGIHRKGIPFTKYWLEWDIGKSKGSSWVFSFVFGYVPPDICTRTYYLIFLVKFIFWYVEITLNWRY